MKLLIQSFSLFFFSLGLSNLGLSSEDLSSTWTQKAKSIRLAESPEWRRVLLYTPHWTGRSTSLGDDPHYFLHAQGDVHADLELEATIQSFFAPWTQDPELHPICRYPRRFSFLQKKLGPTFAISPMPICKNYQQWREEHPVEGISLVFASNYLNNPASLYGHTFIRLHRTRNDGSGSAALLDYAVNFAANPSTTNAFLYPILGLSGRFWGTFSLMPYYIKVQEYNNAESRDLYEYPLLFSQEEVSHFMEALWEAGPYGIRYWYMDENCSYVLLAMIAAARTALEVTEGFYGVVSPKDTLLVLKNTNILQPPVRRPSAYSRFMIRRADLKDGDVTILEQLLSANSLTKELTSQPAQNQIYILDTFLEWLAWKEKLAGSKVAVEHKTIWKEALTHRASLGQPSSPLDTNKYLVTPPDEGHRSHRTYLAYRFSERDHPEMMFGLRLTLHDYSSPPAGYSPDQETTMGDFQGVLHKNSKNQVILEWERFTWVRILSAPPYDSLAPSLAWTITAQTQRQWGYSDTPWLSHHLEGGAGVSFGSKNFRIWAIPVLEIGHLLPERSPIHVGYGIRSGLTLDPHKSLRLLTQFDGSHQASHQTRFWKEDLSQSLSWMHRQSYEIRMVGHLKRSTARDWSKSAELSGLIYF